MNILLWPQMNKATDLNLNLSRVLCGNMNAKSICCIFNVFYLRFNLHTNCVNESKKFYAMMNIL